MKKQLKEVQDLINEMNFEEVEEKTEVNSDLVGKTFVVTGSVNVFKNRKKSSHPPFRRVRRRSLKPIGTPNGRRSILTAAIPVWRSHLILLPTRMPPICKSCRADVRGGAGRQVKRKSVPTERFFVCSQQFRKETF